MYHFNFLSCDLRWHFSCWWSLNFLLCYKKWTLLDYLSNWKYEHRYWELDQNQYLHMYFKYVARVMIKKQLMKKNEFNTFLFFKSWNTSDTEMSLIVNISVLDDHQCDCQCWSWWVTENTHYIVVKATLTCHHKLQVKHVETLVATQLIIFIIFSHLYMKVYKLH